MIMPKDIKKCCYTCKYLEYDKCSSDRAYCSGQKDSPRIEHPDHHLCDRYKNMMYKTDSLEEKEPVNENKMDDYPFKEVTVQKRAFNEEFWIIGDLYVLDKKIYCLVSFENYIDAATFWNIETGYATINIDELVHNYNTIKHIKKESLIKDVI